MGRGNWFPSTYRDRSETCCELVYVDLIGLMGTGDGGPEQHEVDDAYDDLQMVIQDFLPDSFNFDVNDLLSSTRLAHPRPYPHSR